MPQGFLSVILHAHLPYVRHPEYDNFLEEMWFYEAITETYIPLLEMFEGLTRDGVDFRITMSLTPTLVSMFTDPLLQERYLKHLQKLMELADKEVERTRHQPEFNHLAKMYQHLFQRSHYVFCEQYQRNLVNGFKRFQDQGCLEIIGSAATHGFLPLMLINPEAVRAQIAIGVDNYRKNFGRSPRGFWLPECAYAPGIDEILKEFGIRYFITDTHGVLFASRRPKYGVFAPIYCPSGVAAFGRDGESSKQVWSAEEGYPGDFDYREFYRDIGFDLDLDYVKPYIHPDGIRIHTGLKYYRITGKTNHKEPYVPDWARGRAASHAGNFMFNREKQVEWLAGIMDRQPLIVSPYDAELFGHWWFEGPQFLDFLFRKLHYDQNTIKTITPSEYLKLYPCNQVATPAQSTWGNKGYNEVWLESSNDWIYRYLHKAASRMVELADQYPQAAGLTERALNQAARELVLAQSSDWAFIMKTGTAVEYAVKRTKQHILNFTRLYDEIKAGQIDEGWLQHLEWKHNIFPNINYRVYRTDYRGTNASLPLAVGL
ncbi:MAG: glycoside hydrolase family 57 protein [Bacillota bacterium]|jgi:1,4-alpha-glucan branching enzyme